MTDLLLIRSYDHLKKVLKDTLSEVIVLAKCSECWRPVQVSLDEAEFLMTYGCRDCFATFSAERLEHLKKHNIQTPESYKGLHTLENKLIKVK